MGGRKLLLMALALVALGLSALAATRGLPFHGTESITTSCSSCDARHQSHKRISAGR
jgi:hypothetical protein